jgi:hypothetical protein
MHDDLIDRVQDEREDEDVSNILPALSDQLSPEAPIR